MLANSLTILLFLHFALVLTQELFAFFLATVFSTVCSTPGWGVCVFIPALAFHLHRLALPTQTKERIWHFCTYVVMMCVMFLLCLFSIEDERAPAPSIRQHKFEQEVSGLVLSFLFVGAGLSLWRKTEHFSPIRFSPLPCWGIRFQPLLETPKTPDGNSVLARLMKKLSGTLWEFFCRHEENLVRCFLPKDESLTCLAQGRPICLVTRGIACEKQKLCKVT